MSWYVIIIWNRPFDKVCTITISQLRPSIWNRSFFCSSRLYFISFSCTNYGPTYLIFFQFKFFFHNIIVSKKWTLLSKLPIFSFALKIHIHHSQSQRKMRNVVSKSSLNKNIFALEIWSQETREHKHRSLSLFCT